MSSHQEMALELLKQKRMRVRYQRKLRELERLPERTPDGRREHLERQVQDLTTRLNGHGG
jgi:hypothetical protein